MKTYLTSDELVKKATKAGFDFGKGDPYNRLRYYTKIGWIPHMVRRKTSDGNIEGHYHKSIIDRLLLIQDLKNKALSNDEISSKLQTRDKLKDFYAYLKTDQFRTKAITYGTFFLIMLIFLAELGILKIGKSKDPQLIVQSGLSGQEHVKIIRSGQSFIPQGQHSVFIKTEKVTEKTQVYITFEDNYSPATRFWVAQKTPQAGFVVELDAPVEQNAGFTWWISE